MDREVNGTDKYPQRLVSPSRCILISTSIVLLSTGLAASCSVYDNGLITEADPVTIQPLFDAGSPRDAAYSSDTIGNRGDGIGPTAIDTDDDAGKDDADNTICGIDDEDCSGTPHDADSLPEDAMNTSTDSASPTTDAVVGTDDCPDDPDKMTPGACGCGHPDTDTDDDGTPDCDDKCPQDNRKTDLGICGCGNEDPFNADNSSIYCAKSHLLHRYSFNGIGSTATDSVGQADGTIHGLGLSDLQAAGSLELGGDRGSGYLAEGYVELPTSVWEGLANATFEAWVTWQGRGDSGDARWQRIFDFGNQINSEGDSFLFLTPQGETGVHVALTDDHSRDNDDIVTTSTVLPQDVEKHLAVVVDGDASKLKLYIDGAWQGSVPTSITLDQIDAVHCWLGRSNFAVDSEFNGFFHEFRIWNIALSDEQLSTSFSAGPDYEFN